MWFGRLFCAIDRHDPDRNRVRWDGFAYVGQCTHCGTPIRRLRKHRWTASFRGHAFLLPPPTDKPAAPQPADAQP